MKRKLLFYYTNSKSVFLALLCSLIFTCAQAQINLAPQATPSAAPGCSTGPCSTLNDLNYGNCGTQQMWISCNATNPGSTVNMTFVWPTIKNIKGLTIHVGEMNNRFLTGGTIQKWDGSTWATVMTFTQSSLGVCSYNIDFPLTISTTQLRIIDLTVGGAQSSNCNFREIEIWQGSMSNNDIGVTSIDSPTTFCSPLQNIYARVSNYGKNQITGFTVNWSLDGILQSPVISTASLDTPGGAGTNSLPVMLGTYSFPINALTRVRAWTSMPGGIADTTITNDSAAAWKIQGLSGNYTIGGVGASFPDMLQAALALKVGGVCGPVVFTVNPGTYVGQIELKSIAGVSATNTITFEGVDKNTCIISYAASNTTGDYHTIAIDNTPYVTLHNLTILGTGTTAGFGVVVQNGSHYIKIRNCIVNVNPALSANFASIAITGSRASATTATRVDYAEIDSNILNGYYGFVDYAGSGVNINNGLKFTNNVVNYTYNGFYAYYCSTIKVENNILNGLTTAQAGNGIYLSQLGSGGSTPNTIINNKLTNTGYYGIYIATGANTAGSKGIIANNFVGGSASPTAYYGLYLSTGTNWRITHNTILFNVLTPTLSYVPAYISSGSGNTVTNNIFRTKSIGATFYGSGAGVFDTLDNNMYSRPTRGANYFYLGAYYTDTTFKGVSGFNVNSITSDPGFKNDSVLLVSQPCFTGNPNSGITKDYFGVTRNVTSPTLGAAEYLRYADELMIEAVKKPVAPVTGGYQDVEVLVRNSGTTTLTAFAVNYTDNGGFPVSVYWTGSLSPCDTTTVVFNGANQLNLTSSHNLVFYTSSPNFLTDPNTANDTIRMLVELPLNGNYVIGAAPSDFLTPQAAAFALKNSGITGPVSFTVKPGTYSGQFRIEGPVPGNNITNTITIDGVDAATRIIDANVPQPAVLMSGVSYITFKNFTVNNTSATANTSGIALVGSFVDKTGTGSTIKNNIVNLPNVGINTSYGINITAATNGTGMVNNNMDSITVDSNTVNGGYYGLVFYGNTAGSTTYNRFARMRGNSLNKIYYMGAYVYYIYNAVEFTRNTIVMDTANTGTTYGLYFYYCLNSSAAPHLVSNNKIVNSSYMGMYLYNFGSPVASPMQVYNNIVTGISKYSTFYGIYTYGTGATANINCYHNTVLAQTAATAPPTIYGIYYSNTGTVKNFKNNIIGILTSNASPTSAPFYAGNAITGNSVDYNTYYNMSSSNMVYLNNVYYNTSNYRVANIGGDNSFNVNPGFSNILAPTLTEGCLRGVNLTADVPADYNGTTRSTAPNLGALEFVGPSNDLSLETMVYPVAPVTLGTQDLALRVRNNGSNVITGFNAAYTLNNGTPVVYNWSGTLNPCEAATVIFTGANQVTIGGSNNIVAYTYAPNGTTDAFPTNDTFRISLVTPLNGNYTVGSAPSDFATVTQAVNALTRGVSGPVRFNIKTGTYNESIILNEVTGASATNTITFTSLANHVDSVNLAWTSVAASPFVVRFSSLAKYYTFDRITISQLSNAGNYSNIQLLGSTSFDTIRNCKLNSPAYISSATYNIYGAPFYGEGVNIHKNEINGAYYGIYLDGGSRAAGFKSVIVNGNTINNFYYSPVYYFQYSRSSAVTNNTFNTPANASTGIYCYFYYNDSGYKNTGNVFNTLSGKTVYWYNYYSNNSSADKSLIANNQIKGSGNNYFYVGNTATNNQDIVHNTFNMNAGYLYITTPSLSMRVANNVLTGSSYVYYFNGTPSSTTFTSNFNLVYSTSATPYYANTAARSASYFRTTYAPLESRSVYTRAGLNGTVPNVMDTDCWSLNGTGAFLGYALNDANGTPRPQTRVEGAPDLGAFEFTPNTGTTPPVLTAVPATPVAGGTQVFFSGLDTVAKITWDPFVVPPTTITGRLYTGAYPPGLSGVTHKSLNMYWSFEAPSAFYTYTISLYFRPTLRGSIVNAADMIGTKQSGANPWTAIYAPQSTVDSVAGILTITNLYDFSLFTGTDASNPLPVSLSKFNATAQRNDVLVSWTTASEKNASHFEVYGSADGKNYRAVSGKIKAKGNSNVSNDYSFTDANALANANVLYYKLKTTDRDGSFEWSEIAIVKTGNNSKAGFVVYPNPFSNNLTLTVPANGKANVEITSLQGEKLLEKTLEADQGKIALTNLAELKPGVYFIKITQEGVSYIEKLVKQ